MSRYLIFGIIFLCVVFGIFLILPSSSPVEEVEDIKYIIDKKEEKDLHKTSNSVTIEYESTQSLPSQNSSNSTAKIFVNEESKIDFIEKLIGEKDLEPLYKEWKSVGDLSYNVYIKPTKSKEPSQGLMPPTMPSFNTVVISGEKINIFIPEALEAYIVTKKGSEIKYDKIESSSLKSTSPPTVGN